MAQLVKNLPAIWVTWVGKIPWRRDRKGYPLQYFYLESSMDCVGHGVTKSQTWLSDSHFHFQGKTHRRTLRGTPDLAAEHPSQLPRPEFPGLPLG